MIFVAIMTTMGYVALDIEDMRHSESVEVFFCNWQPPALKPYIPLWILFLGSFTASAHQTSIGQKHILQRKTLVVVARATASHALDAKVM